MLREIVEKIGSRQEMFTESSKNGLYIVDGTKRYYKNGKRHRDEKDGPAVIYADGSKFYYKNGKQHRDNGPAVIWPNGGKEYYKNDKLHRDEKDGPAVIWSDGTKFFYQNDKQHRTDGPAVIYADGTVEFWLNDEEIYRGTPKYDNFKQKYSKKHPEWFK